MKAESLSWEDLRVFLHVARQQSFSKASKTMKVDQSTISRRINHLEYVLGFSLFERTPAGVRLNQHSRKLLAQVEVMGVGFEGVVDELMGEAGGVAGQVRVGTMEGLASLFLSQHLPALKKLHPNIALELVTSPQPLHVARREADIFLGFFEPHGQGFDSELLGSFKLHLYASSDYLAKMPQPTIDSLRDCEFVGYIDELIQIDAVRWLEEILPEPKKVFYSNSMLAQMFAAAAGMGIVVLPEFSQAERFGLQRILEKETNLRRELWLSVHRDLRYIPRIKATNNFLTCLFKDNQWFQS